MFPINIRNFSPACSQLVRQDARGQRGAVVAAPAHQHDTQLGHLPLRAEFKGLLPRLHHPLAALSLHQLGVAVLILASDVLLAVLDVGGINRELIDLHSDSSFLNVTQFF